MEQFYCRKCENNTCIQIADKKICDKCGDCLEIELLEFEIKCKSDIIFNLQKMLNKRKLDRV